MKVFLRTDWSSRNRGGARLTALKADAALEGEG